jgi:phosphoribosyl 1,2-cyclic phosphodiesterase
LRFTVLASGSGGNASLVESGGFGLLIDLGLGPRQLAERFAAVGLSWASVQAVVLTHTHSDHWKDRSLAHLRRRRVPLYCHAGHRPALAAYAPSFAALEADGLVRPYEAGRELPLAPGLRCRPLPLRHDGGATFGFRLEGAPDLFGSTAALGYVADLGCWDEALADALADVDLLAVEFNHDEALERASGRGAALIARVLGDEGHLSNAQAAELVRAVLRRPGAGRLRHLVQLHLSRDCNRTELAQAAGRAALGESAAELHTARQDLAGKTLPLGAAADRRPRRGRPPGGGNRAKLKPLWLPGLEPDGEA